MIAYPPAKLNLGLYVLDRRNDGYHNLATLFFPYPALHDLLEVVEAPGTAPVAKASAEPRVQLFLYGLPVPGDPAQNLCCKAWHLLDADFGLPPTHIHLCKQIPMGAGLGGGSSDGAACLQLLNRLYGLGLDTARLREYGVKLGMDVPFFLQDAHLQDGPLQDAPLHPCIGSGRGEVLEPFALNLEAYRICVETFPHIHLSTAEAYAALNPRRSLPGAHTDPITNFKDLVSQPIESWKNRLQNHFEEALAARFPEIAQGIAHLYAQGAVYAALTGSGSAIYGIFTK